MEESTALRTEDEERYKARFENEVASALTAKSDVRKKQQFRRSRQRQPNPLDAQGPGSKDLRKLRERIEFRNDRAKYHVKAAETAHSDLEDYHIHQAAVDIAIAESHTGQHHAMAAEEAARLHPQSADHQVQPKQPEAA